MVACALSSGTIWRRLRPYRRIVAVCVKKIGLAVVCMVEVQAGLRGALFVNIFGDLVDVVHQLHRMSGRVDLYTWSYQHIVADGNLVAIYQDATDVDGYIISNVNIISESADEFIANGHIGSYASKLFFQ